MSIRTTYEEKTERLILPILEENGFELVDVEYVKEGGNYFLRCYIDKEGGITINDCELVSRAMDELLDREDFIKGSYTFEVSSPGLTRPLKKDRDFERSLGKAVEVRTYQAIDKQKEFYGILSDYTDTSVTIMEGASEDGEGGTERTFDRSQIALIRLALIF